MLESVMLLTLVNNLQSTLSAVLYNPLWYDWSLVLFLKFCCLFIGNLRLYAVLSAPCAFTDRSSSLADVSCSLCTVLSQRSCNDDSHCHCCSYCAYCYLAYVYLYCVYSCACAFLYFTSVVWV